MSTTELNCAKDEARRLALALAEKHYPGITEWQPADDLIGLILQISNMTSGMCHATPAAPAPNESQIDALKAAVEGECHGLAISDEQARAILSYVLCATPPAPAPEGWVTVPKEPTPEMVRAGSGAQSTVSDCGSGLVFAATETDIYRVMISAAPAAPVQMAPLWIKAAMCALEACEQDLGETLPDDYVLGRINESSGSPSFRIRVGHIRQLAAPATPNGWQDISTAPKDGTEILILRNGRVAIGRWNEDKYTKNPRPYWDGTDAAWQGKIWAREKEPTKWQPLPAAPTEAPNE